MKNKERERERERKREKEREESGSFFDMTKIHATRYKTYLSIDRSGKVIVPQQRGTTQK